MSTHRRPLALVLCAVLALGLSGGCSTTTIATVWKSPDAGPVRFTRVLAVVLNASPAERRAGEDELARSIRSAPAVPSYTLVSDDDLKDKARVLAAIEGRGFDGAAVIRLVSRDKRTTYVAPQYGPRYDPLNYTYIPPTHATGYTTTDTIITAEASLHSIADRKLIWAGSTTTENPASIEDLVAQAARAAVKELKRAGLVQ